MQLSVPFFRLQTVYQAFKKNTNISCVSPLSVHDYGQIIETFFALTEASKGYPCCIKLTITCIASVRILVKSSPNMESFSIYACGTEGAASTAKTTNIKIIIILFHPCNAVAERRAAALWNCFLPAPWRESCRCRKASAAESGRGLPSSQF